MNLVFIGKSGSGKTEICNKITENFRYDKMVTMTTRNARDGETNGIDYNFVTREEFLNKIRDNEFIEYTEYAGNYYGITKNDIENINNKIFIVDRNGLRNLKQCRNFNFVSFYIDCDDNTRFVRQFMRGDSVYYITKKKESDELMFNGAKEEADFIITNNENVWDAIVKILEFIRSVS